MDTNPNNQIGSSLKQLRKSAKLTQQNVASLLNTTRSSIARVESNDSNPTLSTINKFAKACGGSIKISIEAEKIQ